jgi:D-lyxose ketol-isomerase
MDGILKAMINNTTVEINFEENDPSTIQLMRFENQVLIDAKHKLTLHCGKLSVTLHPKGKIVLWGDYTLNDAEVVSSVADDRVELTLNPDPRWTGTHSGGPTRH